MADQTRKASNSGRCIFQESRSSSSTSGMRRCQGRCLSRRRSAADCRSPKRAGCARHRRSRLHWRPANYPSRSPWLPPEQNDDAMGHQAVEEILHVSYVLTAPSLLSRAPHALEIRRVHRIALSHILPAPRPLWAGRRAMESGSALLTVQDEKVHLGQIERGRPIVVCSSPGAGLREVTVTATSGLRSNALPRRRGGRHRSQPRCGLRCCHQEF
jgi:hypothetical protein